ncbi:hypothetical protein GCM10010399_69230 [Dactylosporangium fulvum]
MSDVVMSALSGSDFVQPAVWGPAGVLTAEARRPQSRGCGRRAGGAGAYLMPAAAHFAAKSPVQSSATVT